MREYIMNTIVWLLQPFINKIDQFRNWRRRDEIRAEKIRKQNKRQADQLCNDIISEYLNAIQELPLSYGEQERIAIAFTRKVNQLYSYVR